MFKNTSNTQRLLMQLVHIFNHRCNIYDLSQHEHAGIRGNFAAAEISRHPFPGNPFELKRNLCIFSYGKLNLRVLYLCSYFMLTAI